MWKYAKSVEKKQIYSVEISKSLVPKLLCQKKFSIVRTLDFVHWKTSIVPRARRRTCYDFWKRQSIAKKVHLGSQSPLVWSHIFSVKNYTVEISFKRNSGKTHWCMLNANRPRVFSHTFSRSARKCERNTKTPLIGRRSQTTFQKGENRQWYLQYGRDRVAQSRGWRLLG